MTLLRISVTTWTVTKNDMIFVLWTDLLWTDLLWTDLLWTDLLWTDLLWTDLLWTDLLWTDLLWTDLLWTDLLWTDLLDRPFLEDEALDGRCQGQESDAADHQPRVWKYDWLCIEPVIVPATLAQSRHSWASSRLGQVPFADCGAALHSVATLLLLMCLPTVLGITAIVISMATKDI
ncbi:MAG: hypothetical protein MMC23_005266 [Stictis urceolatum]|nr:hypothetical protein [Stictis urceolata]